MSGYAIDYQHLDPYSVPPDVIVCRYLDLLTVAEQSVLLGRRVRIIYNFERGAADYRGGYAKGFANGQAAGADMNRLGWANHPEIPVFNSGYDTDIQPGEFALCAQFQRGFVDGMGGRHAECYCEGALGEYLVACGLARFIWQSESTSFAGNATPTPHTVMRQVYGFRVPGVAGDYDGNLVLSNRWFGYYPVPTPTPPPPKRSHDMFLLTTTPFPGFPSYVPRTLWLDEVGNIFLSNGMSLTDVHDNPIHTTALPVPNAKPGQVFNVIPSNVFAAHYSYGGAETILDAGGKKVGLRVSFVMQTQDPHFAVVAPGQPRILEYKIVNP